MKTNSPSTTESSTLPGIFVDIDGIGEVFDCTAHLLKIAIRKYKPEENDRRVYVYHSWRAVIKGEDSPLDKEELSQFHSNCPVDLFLVGSEHHREYIWRHLQKPSIVLPYTAFIPSSSFNYTKRVKDFDLVFFCMFNEEQYQRKNAYLFLNTLRVDPSLRALWIGDYDFYDRWCMEEGFNSFFETRESVPSEWLPLWTEEERNFCWLNGSGFFSFPTEQKKLQAFLDCYEDIRKEKLDVTLYRSLSRNQVAHVLNRCRSVVVLSSRDQWPRCITESLACGLPVIATHRLVSGLQVLDFNNSIVVNPEATEIAKAVRAVDRFDRERIAKDFHSRYGLINCTRLLIQTVEELGIRWSEIVDWQRPAETLLKQEVRSEFNKG